MKKFKKLGGLLLALCMVFSVTFATSFAVTAYEAPEIESENDGGTGIVPMASYVILNEAITSRGVSWEQPNDYHAYRVWVENTTNEKMTVTVDSSGGTFIRGEDKDNTTN